MSRTACVNNYPPKGVEQVCVFEKRATLCPLQEGSDARWVHPKIYDWPNKGSESPAAALPVVRLT